MSSIVIKKKFETSAEEVFNAWLDPESVKIWMCPKEGVTVPTPEIDPKVGGKFKFDMKMGDMAIPHDGEFKTLEPPHKLQFSWRSPNTGEEDSIVTIEIKSLETNFCELTLTHELLPTEESRQDHQGGWTNILDSLKNALQ